MAESLDRAEEGHQQEDIWTWSQKTDAFHQLFIDFFMGLIVVKQTRSVNDSNMTTAHLTVGFLTACSN
ncbi:hypothetical protein CRENBAI_022949 [Crenichthys baileyi]|uniref:Uncharacterized protein n=1 Tax=Crenichthys baileyi TaxID=28760 RepID=A0AAV9S9S3_9TELE